MEKYSYSKEDVLLNKLTIEINESDISTVLSYINFDGFSALDIFFESELSDEEEVILNDLISAHSLTTSGEENFFVQVNNSRGNVVSETWYNTDNGDGTYSGKVREIVYTYSSNGKNLQGRTEKEFWLDGTEKTSKAFEYYTSGSNKIVKPV